MDNYECESCGLVFPPVEVMNVRTDEGVIECCPRCGSDEIAMEDDDYNDSDYYFGDD